MTATILIENPLPDLPSASGGEIVGFVAFVIGDDLPFLHQLDAAPPAAVFLNAGRASRMCNGLALRPARSGAG